MIKLNTPIRAEVDEDFFMDIADFRERHFCVQHIDRCILIENPPLAAARRAKLPFCLF